MRSRWGSRAGSMAGWALVAVATTCVTSARAVAADARILRYERIQTVTPDRDTALRKSSGELRELTFDAFGRRFALALDANEPLIEKLEGPLRGSSLRLYRGRIDHVAGSWVRLALEGSSLQGMFWDGVDLYVVEPAAQVRDSLAQAPPDLAPGEPIVFRLQDVVIDAAAATCASEPESGERTALDEFTSLVGELKSSHLMAQAPGAAVRLQISAMADALFLQRYASEAQARDAVLVRLNNVDGVFSSQLGVEIQVPSVFANAAQSDPLSNATSPSALLRELAKLRKRSPQLHSAGLTHLFTGRNLDGETVGIAYLNKLCHPEYGVGLTEVRTQNAWRDSLIAAHEIGHNFGASHDGDPLGACPTTASNVYLMSSSVSGSDRFSACSLASMQPRVSAASCITRLPPADLSLPASLGQTHASVGQSFEWRLDVANAGGVAAERVRAEVLVPPVVEVEDAYVIGGSCTSGAGMIFCQLGDVPGGASRAVNLMLRSDVRGANSISARVAADNDPVLTNNRGDGELVIENEADVAVSLEGPASVAAGADFELSFAIMNRTLTEATDVRFTLSLPPGLTAAAAPILSGGTCVIVASSIECSVQSLPGEGSASAAVRLSTSVGGLFTLQARAQGAYFDPAPANDSAEHALEVTGARPVTQQAVSDSERSGGGGASSLLLLLALSGLGFFRRPGGRPAPVRGQ